MDYKINIESMWLFRKFLFCRWRFRRNRRIKIRLRSPKVIPYGMYCYGSSKLSSDGKSVYLLNLCPYWDINWSKGSQFNGYCHYIKQCDWEGDGLGLLWDKVKECHIRKYTGEELDWYNRINGGVDGCQIGM